MDKLIGMYPKDGYAYSAKGCIYLELEQYEKALTEFTKAVELDNTKADYIFNKAVAESYLKKNKEAVEDFTATLKLNDQYVDAYLYRGIVYADMGMKTEAGRDFDKVLLLDPENERAKKEVKKLK